MDNGMTFELYRVNGKNINKEQYFSVLKDTLKDYPFASCEQLCFAMKADKRYVKKMLLLYIVEFAKKNPGLSGVQICKKLKVRFEYLNELITSGNLELVVGNVDEIVEEQETATQLNLEKIEDSKKRNDALLIHGLNSTIKKDQGMKLELKHNTPKYHTHEFITRDRNLRK